MSKKHTVSKPIDLCQNIPLHENIWNSHIGSSTVAIAIPDPAEISVLQCLAFYHALSYSLLHFHHLGYVGCAAVFH